MPDLKAPSAPSIDKDKHCIDAQIQFVRKDGMWKMSAIAWDDERNGLVIPDNHP